MEALEVLSHFLESKGSQVLKAGTAGEGLKLFAAQEPDAIFLDIMLPDKNGLEMLKEIKGIDPDMPVIMVTGYKDAEKVVDAFRAGAFDCLLKPINFDYLSNDVLPRIPLKKR